MTTTTLIAFHGDPKIKGKYLRRVQRHRKADELIRGTGFNNGKGCAVGCTLNKYDHAAYETELGIPKVLARLEDVMFERMELDEAMKWPTRFLSAVPVGADLSMVWPRFAVWLMRETATKTKRESSKKACESVAAAYERHIAGSPPSVGEWRKIHAAAYAAAEAAAYADAAADAAYSAAYSADAAYSARAKALAKMADLVRKEIPIPFIGE